MNPGGAKKPSSNELGSDSLEYLSLAVDHLNGMDTIQNQDLLVNLWVIIYET